MDKRQRLTRFLSVAVRKRKALDALLRDVLQTGHGAGSGARERAVQLVYPAGWQHTHTRITPSARYPQRLKAAGNALATCAARGLEVLALLTLYGYSTDIMLTI